MAASDRVSTRFLLSPQKSDIFDQQEYKDIPPPWDKFFAAASSPRTAHCGTVLAAMPAVCRDFPTLELEDVEVAASPATVFYKIRVCPFGRGVCSHHVMKTYQDLQNLHEAILRETPATMKLPRLPPEPTVGQYLSDLCCCERAVETHSFRNFFDLAEEREKPGGRGLLPLSEPGLGDARGSSDLPVAPKSAPGGLSGDSAGIVIPEEVPSPHGLPTCIVCFSRPQEMAVVPCGHLSMCNTCSSELKECPLCRGPIEKLLRIYAVE